MARTPASNSHPWRKIILLLVALAVAVGGMALQNLWTPKLGLDLVGGTSILLRADTPSGEAPDDTQMQEAVNIIRNRVSDLAEVEVNTQGDQYVVVEVPGATPKKTRQMVGQTAELRFRQVLGVVPNSSQQGQDGQSGQSGQGNQDGQGQQGDQGDQGGDQGDQSDGSSQQSGDGGDGDSGASADSGGQNDGGDAQDQDQQNQDPQNTNRAATGALAAQDSGGEQSDSGSQEGDAGNSGSQQGDSGDSGSQDGSSGNSGSQGGDQGSDDGEGSQQQDQDGLQISTTRATQEQLAKLQEFDCADTLNQRAKPTEVLFTCDRDGALKYVLGPAMVQGTNVTDASAGVPQQAAQWIVQLEFDGEGQDRIAEASREMYTMQRPLNQFAIVLDSEVISAPTFDEPIPGGQATIRGDFSEQEAQDLAQVLKYGALPLTFHEDEVSQVSPTLGSDQLRLGLVAGGIGMALVLLYALIYYRALGFVIMSSLALAASVTYVAAVWLGAGRGFTLTLAGVAGLIVAIGITADSFVVFFERIRDEMREGKTPRAAVESAWLRARRTILISDAVSLLAALVLYLLSVGSVRSFAYALGLTTVVDAIVVFLFTKPLCTLLVRTKFFGRGHALSGLSASKIGARKRSPYGVRSAQPAIEEH